MFRPSAQYPYFKPPVLLLRSTGISAHASGFGHVRVVHDWLRTVGYQPAPAVDRDAHATRRGHVDSVGIEGEFIFPNATYTAEQSLGSEAEKCHRLMK